MPICGIAGFSISPNEKVNSRQLAKCLALAIEHRGPEATGFAWVTPQGTVQVQKGPHPATQFVRKASVWKKTPTCIIHTRMPTGGSPFDNRNNHPITAGHIIGVHNGYLWNDDTLFHQMGIKDRRQGEVDSEAIFAAIAWGLEVDPTDGLPRIGRAATDLTDVFQEIEGPAAVAWLNTSDDVNRLHVNRIAANPIVCAQTTGGSLVFASEEKAVMVAIVGARLRVARTWSLDEGEWLTFNLGHHENTVKYTSPAAYYKSFTRTTVASTSNYSCGALTGNNDTKPSRTGHVTKYTFRNGQFVKQNIGDTDVSRTSPRYPDQNRYEDGWLPAKRLLSDDPALGYSSELHDRLYRERADAVFEHREWLEAQVDEGFGYTDLDVEMELNDLGANLMVGDTVDTIFNGDVIQATVVQMPNTFPEGRYVLRALDDGGFPFMFTRAGISINVLTPPPHDEPEAVEECVELDEMPSTDQQLVLVASN